LPRKTGWRVLSGLSLAIPTALFGAGVNGTHAAGATISAAQIAQLEQNANQKVIVILKNQHSELNGRAHMAARTAAIKADQAGVVGELSQVQAKNVSAFHLINAVAATVSKAEVAHLRVNPAVQAVVPDMTVRELPNAVERTRATSVPSPVANTTGSSSQLCGTSANPLQNEALSITNDLQATQLKTPQGQLIDGTGVKLAFIADGLNPANVEFQRPNNGGPVITDAVDFVGDGYSLNGAEGEGTGDASMMIGQGNLPYDISQFSGQPLSSPCFVKVQGMAPGATLEALRVFGQGAASTSGTFIRAIQYAVDTGVDVLNESFGGNPYPNLANDPIALADAAAVANGVVVTASTGDAGSTGTLGTPSTLQDVIAACATTDLRSEDAVSYPGTGRGTGWLSNEMSPFSSGGVSDNGQRTVDVVAPGNSDWSACDGPFCTDFTSLSGNPSPLELFGGTSESAPLTAGEAALVIQAYRSTHNGDNPTPGQVKEIIKSTATNLNFPADQQGAGLINAFRAVQAALSLPDANAVPHAQGDSFIATAHAGTSDPDSTLFAQNEPNTPVSFSVQATNTGTHTEIMQPKAMVLGTPTVVKFSTTLDSNSTQFTDTFGRNAYEVTKTFTVPAGKQYMNFQYANNPGNDPNNPTGPAHLRMTLYDPSGRYAAYSRPQGVGESYGNIQIHDPQPGTWKAVFFTIDPNVGASYFGPINVTVDLASFVSTGVVTPASLPILPGKSASFNVSLKTPAQPGTQTVNLFMTGVVAATRQAATTVLPVVLTSYVHVANNHGSFNGFITGSNGRGGAGDDQTFTIPVPAGVNDLDLGVTLGTADPNYNLEGVLIDPAGNPVNVQSNALLDANGNIIGFDPNLQIFERNPAAGVWRFDLVEDLYGSGAQTQEPFTGTVTFNGVQVDGSEVPNSASTTLTPANNTVTVTVTNNGNTPEEYYIGGRLADAQDRPVQTDYTLGYQGPLGIANPNLTPAVGFPVPPESTQVTSFAFGTAPFDQEMFDNAGSGPFAFIGTPDVMGNLTQDQFNPLGPNGGWDNIATLGNGNDTRVPQGFYVSVLSGVGPFNAPASGTDVAYEQGQVTTQAFDPAVCASTTDLWAAEMQLFGAAVTNNNPSCDATQKGYTPNPLILPPHTSGQITVTFTPSDAPGTVEHGDLYVYTFPNFARQDTFSGDDVAKIPYTYTVG
jgi:hypothetical protein